MDGPIISQEEIDKKNNKLILLTNDDYLLIKEKFDIHTNKYDFFNYTQPVLSPGQHFLYEIIGGRSYHNDGTLYSLSYPKLGIYLNTYPCDQTIELEWVDHRRTWEYRLRYNEYCCVGEMQSVLRYLALWSDSILIYGVWDAKPNWKQLKQAYEKTWWFWKDSQELRDIQINRILNGN